MNGNAPPLPTYNWKYLVGFLMGLIAAFIVIVVVANTVPPPPPPSYGFAKVPTATYGYQAPSPAQTPALNGYAQPQLPDQSSVGGYSNSPAMSPAMSPSPAQTPALNGYSQPQLPDQSSVGGYSNSPAMSPAMSPSP